MPQYDWKCDECDKQETTIQPISASDVPPEQDPEDACVHRWRKVFLAAPQKAYGPNWGWGRKGEW